MLSDDDRLDEIRERLADPIRSGFMRRLDQSELSWCAAEIARLRAELDRRPEITPEDAELFSRTSHAVSRTIEDRIPGYADAMSRIASALQGHAEKAVKS